MDLIVLIYLSQSLENLPKEKQKIKKLNAIMEDIAIGSVDIVKVVRLGAIRSGL